MASDVVALRQNRRLSRQLMGTAQAFLRFTTQDSQVHEVGHRKGLSSPGRPHGSKNSMAGFEPSSRGETHVDIYHGVRKLDGGTPATTDRARADPQNTNRKNASRCSSHA